VTLLRLIQAALHGGRRMTVAQLMDATGCAKTSIQGALRHAPNLIVVDVIKAKDGANGGGRMAKVWALKGSAPAYVPERSALGPGGLMRGDIRDTEGVTDPEQEGARLPSQSGPMSWITFEASAETAECPSQGTVRLADCIDGYVDATACERGTPCDSCPIGRQRRAAWAGADFEDSPDEAELDA